MAIEFYTIGVYGLDAEHFFDKLTSNKIDTFVDVRRRRAVRGSEYSFVNSNRLQAKLKQLGINYLHVLDLSPTDDIRKLQYAEDEKKGVGIRQRTELSSVFKKKYQAEILDKYELGNLVKQLEALPTKRAVLFCVEKEASACHRSMVADKLHKKFHSDIKHI
jgi:uncharacterized protein (DUF488 family)